MGRLADFARAQILEREAQLAPPPRPGECQLVESLASVCVASQAGVSARDFLVSLDGEPAAKLATELAFYLGEEHEWVFYARTRHERVRVKTTGAEPGITIRQTPEAVKAAFDPKAPDYSALEVLWEARDSGSLEKLSRATLDATGDRGTPALVFLGAALYEGPRRREGLELVQDYAESFGSHWTQNFMAVALHYLGRDALDRGDRDRALTLLQASFDRHAFDRTAHAIEKASGRRPPKPQPAWVGRRFPAQDYRLPLLENEQRGTASLGDALGALGPGELHLVCLLDGYRGNGPYNGFMRRYHGIGKWFAPFVRGLHVVTEVPERPPERDHYFRSEDRARQLRLPFVVVYDEPGALTSAIEPPGSPHVLALDRQGVVQGEGELSGSQLWEALARAEGG
jgi:hypothetical protein